MREVIILAGGLGTRLKSVINDRPKCMALVADKPFLAHIFDMLELNNTDHVILSLGYKHQYIIDWLSSKQNYSFRISWVVEDSPLGTGGAIQLATTKLITKNCFILNGDTFFNVDMDKISNFHKEKRADITLALKPMAKFDRYGSVDLDKNGRITKFIEKKYCLEGLINGGVYLINKSIFETIRIRETYSFEKDILETRIKDLNIFGFKDDAYFIDIGIPSDYEKANSDFINK